MDQDAERPEDGMPCLINQREKGIIGQGIISCPWIPQVLILFLPFLAEISSVIYIPHPFNSFACLNTFSLSWKTYFQTLVFPSHSDLPRGKTSNARLRTIHLWSWVHSGYLQLRDQVIDSYYHNIVYVHIRVWLNEQGRGGTKKHTGGKRNTQ